MSEVLTVEKINQTSWKYVTTGDGPFDWYHQGNRVGTSLTTSFLYTYSAEQAPVLEVVDLSIEDTTSLRSNKYTSSGILTWRGRVGISSYVVYRKDGAILTEIGEVEGGEGRYYTKTVDLVGDGSLEVFLIECLNMEGDSICSFELNACSIAEPAPPNVSFIAAGGNLEITSNG